MIDHTTFVPLVAALFAVHFVAVWLVGRRARPDDGRPNRLEDGRLQCPDYEAVNDADYRFCRECVGTLQERAPTAPRLPASGGSTLR